MDVECACKLLCVWMDVCARITIASHIWPLTLSSQSLRCRCWSDNPDWWTDSHHRGRKGCWERQGDMQRVHPRGGRTRCGRCGKRGRHVWHLLHSTAAWRVCHLRAFWRGAHPEQSLPSHGERRSFLTFYLCRVCELGRHALLKL